jgi:hypothetical protein
MTGSSLFKAAAVFLALIFWGCSQQAEIKNSSSGPAPVTLEQLQGSWLKYFIRYSTNFRNFNIPLPFLHPAQLILKFFS